MKIAKKVKQLLNPPKPQWLRFFESTHNTPRGFTNKKRAEWITINYKAYARMPLVTLPKPSILRKQSLVKVLTDVSSNRQFSDNTISLKMLSTLLYYSLGVRNPTEKNPDNLHRFYPSAGARYPIEAYVIAHNVHGLKKGIYHYYVREHVLEKIENRPAKIGKDYVVFPFVDKASALIVLTAVFARTTNKYGSRGYNYALLEAGHMGQNLYLLSSALGMSACPVGGFYETAFNTLLRIDPSREPTIYMMAVGSSQQS